MLGAVLPRYMELKEMHHTRVSYIIVYGIYVALLWHCWQTIYMLKNCMCWIVFQCCILHRIPCSMKLWQLQSADATRFDSIQNAKNKNKNKNKKQKIQY